MYWKFNVLNSPLDALLDKEDLTLQEVLDEDDVLQECRVQNRKLIDFLIRKENILQLVSFVIDEPDPNLDDKCKYKYPNVSCEVLTSEVAEITDSLVNDEDLLNKIYSFLESEGPVNPLQASFFSKVFSLLIARKSDTMLDYLQNRPNFVGQLLHHMNVSAIMDLLLRLVTCLQSLECRRRCIKWLDELKLIQRIIGMIHPSHTDEMHSNASQALCDMIVLAREHMAEMQENAEDDPLLLSIESTENITTLLDNMFGADAPRSESILVNGLAVLQTLLEFRKVGPEGSCEQMTSLDAERLANAVRHTIEIIEPRLKDLKEVLLHPPKQFYSPMNTTAGTLDPPMGNARLQIVHLIASLILTNTASINRELAKIGIMDTMFDLYFKYPLNNFLHSQVEGCVTTIVNNTYVAVDKKDEHPLLEQMFKETKITNVLVDAYNSNEKEQVQPSGRRRGNMGHLIKMANSINEQMESGFNGDKIKQLIKGDADMHSNWEKFVNGPLADCNRQTCFEMLNHLSSEDDEFGNIPFPTDMGLKPFSFKEDSFANQEQGPSPFADRLSNVAEIEFPSDNATTASASAAAAKNPCDEKTAAEQEAAFQEACDIRMQDLEDDMWETKDFSFGKSEPGKPSSPAAQSTGTPIVPGKTIPFVIPSTSSSSPQPPNSPRAPNVSPAGSPHISPSGSPHISPGGSPLITPAGSARIIDPLAPPPGGKPSTAGPNLNIESLEDDDDIWETKEITFAKNSEAEVNPVGVSSTTPPTRRDAKKSDSDDEEFDEDTKLPMRIFPDKPKGKGKKGKKGEKMDFEFTNVEKMDESSSEPVAMDTSPWGGSSNNNASSNQADESWANFSAAFDDNAASFDDNAASSSQQADFADFSCIEAMSTEAHGGDVEMESSKREADYIVDSTTSAARNMGDGEEISSSSEPDPIVLPKGAWSEISEQPSSSSDTAPQQPSSSSSTTAAAAVSSASSSEIMVDSNSNQTSADVNTSEAEQEGEDIDEDQLADNFSFLSRGLMAGSAGGIEGGADEQVSSSGGQEMDKVRAQAQEAMEDYSGATSSTSNN